MKNTNIIKTTMILAISAILGILKAYALHNKPICIKEKKETFNLEFSKNTPDTAYNWSDSLYIYQERARHGEVEAFRKLAWYYANDTSTDSHIINMLCMLKQAVK